MSSPVFFGLLSLSHSDLWSWAAWFCLLFVLVKGWRLYLKWKQLVKAFSPFEGPKRHWLFGNAQEFLQKGNDVQIMIRFAEQYPYVFPLWLGNFYAALTICHPDYAKAILSRQDPKDSFTYGFLTPWIGQKWFQHRRLLTPGFHYDVLKPYVRLMSDCVTVMLDKWERLLTKDSKVELFHHVSLMTLDTIMKCAFSCHSNCQMDSESAYIKAVYELSYLADHRYFFLPYHNDVIFHLSPHGFRFRRALKIVHGHTDKVIQERKLSLKEDTELEKIQKKRHLDFLDILLCAKCRWSLWSVGRTVQQLRQHTSTHRSKFHGDGKDMDIIAGYAEQYPYAFPLWLGNFFASLTICHPDYAKAILSRQDPKDNFGYYFITPWIGKGLLVLSGQKWFQHRRLLTPGFHYDVLKPYVKLMSDCVTVMLDKWERLTPKENPVELFHHVSLMTLDSIMKCAFSYQSNCQMDSENAYIKAVYDLSFLVDFRFVFLPYHNDLIFHLSPHGFRFRRALKIAHGHTDKVIKERKQSLKEDTELEKIQKKRHLDFLDILLCAKDENGQGLSDEDLRAEVDTFMFEGHDTTASGISWILYSLAKYPEHQEKCREEIREVLQGRKIVEWEDLGKLTYTSMCIKESMRLYPPVPGVARELKEPITFCDGRSLPKGTDVFISIYAINRCSSVWENPEVFDPLRFSPENTSNRNSHAFLPFSAGGRNCIGQNFAMNEMKVSVALTLQKFELHTVPGKEPLTLPQLVLRSVNGIYLNIKKIDNDKK